MPGICMLVFSGRVISKIQSYVLTVTSSIYIWIPALAGKEATKGDGGNSFFQVCNKTTNTFFPSSISATRMSSHIKLQSKAYFFLLAFPGTTLNTVLLSKEKENICDPKAENLIIHM